jgi:hypothetical protein
MSNAIRERLAISSKAHLLTAALAALVLVALCAPLAIAAKDETTLVSRQSAAGGP